MVLIFIGSLSADLILNYKDLLIVTDNGCYLAGISVIIFKLYVYQSQHKRISNLVEAIHASVSILSRSSDIGISTAVKQCVFYENLSGKFFICLGSALAIVLIFLVPKEEGALPIRAFYPFDISSSPLYELAFSIQAFSVSYGLLTIVLMDELVITLIRWINVQLLILGSNYEKCQQNFTESEAFNVPNSDGIITNCYDRSRTKEKHTEIRSFVPFKQQEADEMNDSFVWKFKTCAQNHQRFIYIVDELNSIFGSSMLMQLFASFSMICLTAFQAALGSEGTQNLMKFVIYLGAACSQLMNWCWFGNELLYQSTSLTTSQWLCGWENKYSDVKTFMIISLIRTKYPLQLKAGKFYNMSLQTFISRGISSERQCHFYRGHEINWLVAGRYRAPCLRL
ncbi:hypothetical protein PV327_006030 [Microctonus hyperodae]|uniref:Odorant receptor n=1 Tax=Microctonus hyperodae TaxID=165561 RepID=A0AA39L0G4_MICHY|nr:hypothetical protein PV327_006030 [Microctonus hyperodae]